MIQVVGEHPDVLAAAAKGERRGPQCGLLHHACQAARHGEVVPAVGHHEEPEHDRTRLVVAGRRARKLDLFLGHELMRALAQPAEPFGAGCMGQRVGLGLRAGGGKRGAEEQLVEVRLHMLSFTQLAAPPGRHGWQLQFLAQQMRRKPGQERKKGRAFHQAGAERVGDGNQPRPGRFHKPGHTEQRFAAQRERVTKGIAYAAQDHVHRAQAVESFQEHPPVPHGQIAPLDQREAQQPGEVGVLEVGFVAWPGRQQCDGRVVGSGGRQPAQRLAAEGQNLRDRARAHGLQYIPQHAREHAPVFEHETESGRRLSAVRQHAPAPFRPARNVGGIDLEIVSPGHPHRLAGPQVAGVRVDERCRDEPVSHQALHAE